MDYKILRKVMEERNVSEESLAERLKMKKETLWKKLCGRQEFVLFEIKIIADFLSLGNDEIINIFFDEKVS